MVVRAPGTGTGMVVWRYGSLTGMRLR